MSGLLAIQAPNASAASSDLVSRAHPRRLSREGRNRQALVYVYARETRADADTAKVLTMDEALGSGHFFTV